MLKELLKANAEGVTIGLDYKPANISRGYAVSLTDNSFLFRDTLTDKQIKRLFFELDKLAQKQGLRNYYYGFWLDKKTNIGYLDLSIVVKSKDLAIKLGKIFNQKAIFNFSKLECIYI